MNSLWQTFKISFALKNTYRVNSIIYSLKQIPLIKKLLPPGLYKSRGLKIFANIIAALWEIISTFLGKAIYIFAMVFVPVTLFPQVPSAELFIHILFFLTIPGAYTNTYLLNPTKDKYYAIILLGMNAREYALTSYIDQMARLIIGMMPFTIIAGRLAEVPLWLCITAPFFVAGAKLIYGALQLRLYEKTGNPISENVLKKAQWAGIGILYLLAYGLPALGVVMPLWLPAALGGLCIVISFFAFGIIGNFKNYRSMYQLILAENAQVLKEAKGAAAKASRKAISHDVTITSRRKGFEYFNELFIKRHRKILWGSVKKITLASLGVVGVLAAAMLVSPVVREEGSKALLQLLPFSLLLMYSINRGTSFTQALFMNCDHSMLTYSFYKKPKDILRLFTIRLREIVKINLLPAGVIGLGLSLLLYIAGGTGDQSIYYIISISLLAMSVFFSVHYLMLYYLLQPYNAGTEMKSSFYGIVVGLTYGVVYGLSTNMEYTALTGLILIGFCLAYSALACILVYFFAPKTFKLRN